MTERLQDMMLQMDQVVRETDASEDASSDPAMSASEHRQSAWKFRLTVVKHHRVVFRACYRLLNDEHEAEDITQETFLKFWQHDGKIEGTRAWLITVARNKCLDRLRKAKRSFDSDPQELEQQPDVRGPDWHVQRNETLSLLDGLIGQLPEPQRSLIILFDVQGLTGSECAEVLGLNVNQVKVYLHRARRHLRRELEVRSD